MEVESDNTDVLIPNNILTRPACGRIVWVVVGVLQDGTNIVRSGVLQVLGGAVFDEPIGQLGPLLATGVWADELAKEKKSNDDDYDESRCSYRKQEGKEGNIKNHVVFLR